LRQVKNLFSDIELVLPADAEFIYVAGGPGLKNGWKQLRFKCTKKALTAFLESNGLDPTKPEDKAFARPWLEEERHSLWDLNEHTEYTYFFTGVKGIYGEDNWWLCGFYIADAPPDKFNVYVQVMESYD